MVCANYLFFKVLKFLFLQIESKLHELLMAYTALCHIYSAQFGGLIYQEFVYKTTAQIEDEIAHGDTNLVSLIGEPIIDEHKIVKQRKKMFCKAHGICIDGNNSVYSNNLDFSYSYFEPYEDTITAFSFALPQLDNLPDDFFERFPNLQYFALDESQKITSLPKGISKCKRLETVTLKRMTLTELPEDLLQAPAITTLECFRLLIKDLPEVWPATSHLTRLVLCGLLIKQVPVEISNLQHLLELDLDYNPITTLPHEFSKLTKLKVLRLTGKLHVAVYFCVGSLDHSFLLID